MKRFFSFLFVLLPVFLFAQVSFGFAKEPSFYEEFDQQEEFKNQEEKKGTAQPDVLKKQNTFAVQDSAVSETQGDFFLTDEKHARFLQDNEQYMLADSMLNQTWKVLTKTLGKKAYRELWQKHKIWLETGRNTVANSFKKQVAAIPEQYAFMLATVAKTQELAQSIWHKPVLGHYVRGDTFVTLTKEEDTIVLQGYGNVPYFAKNTDTAKEESAENTVKSLADTVQGKDTPDKALQADTQKENSPEKLTEKNNIKTMPQLLLRAELPREGKLWLTLSTVNEQKFYLLTTSNSLCLVHAPNVFSFDFNGVFVKK